MRPPAAIVVRYLQRPGRPAQKSARGAAGSMANENGSIGFGQVRHLTDDRPSRAPYHPVKTPATGEIVTTIVFVDVEGSTGLVDRQRGDDVLGDLLDLFVGGCSSHPCLA